MNATYIKSILIAVTMLVGVVLSIAARPTHKLAAERARIDLDAIVPRSFGDWRVDTSILPVQPGADLRASLNKIYSQTVSRTYVNSRGQRIMLSIAYGDDQSDALQVHKPEICYAAQGFQVFKEALGQIKTDYGELPVKRLLAVRGNRMEPITYWITVGDYAIQVGFQQKLAQLKYGVTGQIPDGMLVRASSIDRNEGQAYRLQADFLRQMLAAVSDKNRVRVAGRLGV